MADKVRYTYEQYIDDINRISPIMEDIDHIISIYRGSLPMGVHLSNLYDIPLSIVNFQSRDGDSEEPSWMHYVRKKDNSPYKNVLVIDDIYDSGLTMDKIKKWLEAPALTTNIKQPKYKYLTLYGKENRQDVEYIHEHTGEWIEFWWEVV